MQTRRASYQSGILIDGRYRLLRCLGEGGMGCVWLARHEGLDAPVALKLLKPELCSSASAAPAEALIAEAHITAQVRHPAVVSVFDSGSTPWATPFSSWSTWRAAYWPRCSNKRVQFLPPQRCN